MEKFYRATPCSEEELRGGKYSYQKAKGKINPSPKWERDEDGFFLPTTEGPVRHYGILCAALGATPVNREGDIEHWIDSLTKEAYEHDIQGLMCGVRNAEYRILYKFAAMDARNEQTEKTESDYSERTESFKAENKCFKDTISGDRGKLIDTLTWKYKWIQLYKKPCFLFAQYTIEDLRDWNSLKRLLNELPEEEQKFILASEATYDPDKETCIFDGDAQDEDEELLRCRADVYWREHSNHVECERFREEFIRSYNKLPMANRRLMDRMYELAWDNIYRYKYGKAFGHIPDPWYDKKEDSNDTEGDKTYGVGEEAGEGGDA